MPLFLSKAVMHSSLVCGRPGAAARSVMLCMAQIHAAAGDPAKEAAVLRTVVESARTAASHADKDGEVKANLEAAQVQLGSIVAAWLLSAWLVLWLPRCKVCGARLWRVIAAVGGCSVPMHVVTALQS